MAMSAFDDKTHVPTPAEVEQVLGPARRAWARLEADMQADHGPLQAEWNYAGKPYGWSMRLKATKRAVVYMMPRERHFLASFALGEKACAAVAQAGLPVEIQRVIDEAPKYAEGRAVRIPVRTLGDVAAVRKIAAAKMSS